MARGTVLTDGQRARIVKLLRESELTLKEIGDMFSLTKSAIQHTNDKFGIRKYKTPSVWTVDGRTVDIRGI